MRVNLVLSQLLNLSSILIKQITSTEKKAYYQIHRSISNQLFILQTIIDLFKRSSEHSGLFSIMCTLKSQN